MKKLRLLIAGAAILAAITAHAQENWIIRKHPLYPFSQYNGDTVKYLKQNFDGGANFFYSGKPVSEFLDNIDPAMPIRTFCVHYMDSGNDPRIGGLFLFFYTKDELQQMVKTGKQIYAIGLFSTPLLDKDYKPEIFHYFMKLGVNKVHQWTPEIRQQIDMLILSQGSYETVGAIVESYLQGQPWHRPEPIKSN